MAIIDKSSYINKEFMATLKTPPVTIQKSNIPYMETIIVADQRQINLYK
jgi:hypothetical protein